MSDITLTSEAPTSSPAHAWRWALYGRYAPAAPRGAKHKVIGSGFIAFLGVLGQAADPDGVNRKPPGSEYLSRACRISRDSVARYWKGAEKLGVITVQRSKSGRYVDRYSLVTVPEWMLDWAACEAELSGYKYLADARESRRQDSAPDESESRRHDSQEAAPQTPSPDVRQERVLTSDNGSPDVMLRPGDDHAPDHATAQVVDPQPVRAREAPQEPIPEVEERIAHVPVRVAPWTRQEKQDRMMERFNLRPDDQIAHLVLMGSWATLSAREQARYRDVILPASQRRMGTV